MENRLIPRHIQQSLQGRTSFASDLYTYPAKVLSLVSGTPQSVSIQIEADSYFIMEKLSYVAFGATSANQTEATRVIPLVDITITDSGSGRNLMSAPVDISSLAGHEGLPFILPVERWLQPNSTLNIKFESYSTTTYGRIALYLHGEKRWY